ncbi:hypothetical protein [Streptomyces cylindrosporus]|uniref:Uncharacterized protein n=1 Tax=Streptomyces cylindrosporus TaxID=2927583 RepID=A0ABS9Y2P6_9ACTN|nr:hypothetical protein [Streptomyces cylindrosporus]MCI3271489.1 hypothetical protein [Streptomyces cylindrosporus]
MSVPAPEHRSSEPWESTPDFKWTDRAYDLLEQDLLHAEVKVNDGVLSTRVWGNCPRCAGRLDDGQVLTAVGLFSPIRGRIGAEAAALNAPVVVVDVTCGCGLAHTGAPAGVTGCGVSFRVELVTRADPAAPTVPPTPLDTL